MMKNNLIILTLILYPCFLFPAKRVPLTDVVDIEKGDLFRVVSPFTFGAFYEEKVYVDDLIWDISTGISFHTCRVLRPYVDKDPNSTSIIDYRVVNELWCFWKGSLQDLIDIKKCVFVRIEKP